MAGIVAFGIILPAAMANAERVRWQAFPRIVSEALNAFRNSDEHLASEITQNLDGPRTGRHTEQGRSLNFDPSSELSWVVTDLNRDGRAKVFLLLEIPAGNRMPWGVVMQRHGGGWRVACEFQDEGWAPRGARADLGWMTLLPRRTRGWRHFRVFSGTYGWYPATDTPGAMNCAPLPLGPEP